MRNVLALLGMLIVGFAGLGWYMGWYKLSFSRTSDGNLEIKTNVDTKKVGQDTTEALKNAATVIGSHAHKAAQDANATPPTGAPGGTPGPVVPPQNLPSIPAVPGPAVPAASDAPVVTIPALPAVPGAPVPPRGPITLVPPK